MAQLLPSQRPTITVGGRVFTNIADLIILATVNSTNLYGTFRISSGSSGYQVTSGKTYTVYAIRLFSTTASAWVSQAVGYGDTDVGLNSGSPPTNNVQSFGTAIPSVAGTADAEAPMKFAIPAQKYPYIAGTGGTCTAVIYGYEAA